MKITLFDSGSALCGEWQKVFGDTEGVEVANQVLEHIEPHDCLVTAGNSFGAMSGGIDLAVRNMYGYGIQDYIQLEIMRLFPCGIPIGDLLSINLFPHNQFGSLHNQFGYLLYTPTMRVPSTAVTTDIVCAMMVAVSFANKNAFNSIAIPGLGTGCGQLHPEIAAKAMKIGYDAAVQLIEMDNSSKSTGQ